MKKHLLVFLAALLVIPVSLALTSCGKSDPAPSEDELFKTFKTAYTSDLSYSGSFTKHYYQNNFEGDEDYKTIDVAYNSETDEYAKIEKYFENASTTEFDVYEELYIFKKGEKFAMYSYDGTKKTSTYVDDDYISTNKLSDIKSVIGYLESGDDVLGINPTEFEEIADWAGFKAVETNFDITDEPIELKLKSATITPIGNGTYKMTIVHGAQVSAEVTEIEAVTLTNTNIYTFNASHVLSYEYELKSVSESGQNDMTIKTKESREFKYDSNVMKTDFSDYPSLEAGIVSEVYNTIGNSYDGEETQNTVWANSMDSAYSFYKLILCPINLIMKDGSAQAGKTYHETISESEGNNELKFTYSYSDGAFSASLYLDYNKLGNYEKMGKFITNVKINYTSVGNWELLTYCDQSDSEQNHFYVTKTTLKCIDGNLVYIEYSDVSSKTQISDTVTTENKDNLERVSQTTYDVTENKFTPKAYPSQDGVEGVTLLTDEEAIALANEILDGYKQNTLSFDEENYEGVSVIQAARDEFENLYGGN